MIKYTLDRFEGEFAVLIDDKANSCNIWRVDLPACAKEGDALVYDGESYTIDHEGTYAKKQSIQSRFDRLKKKT